MSIIDHDEDTKEEVVMMIDPTSIINKLVSRLKCNICLEIPDIPIDIGCQPIGHIFCLKCWIEHRNGCLDFVTYEDGILVLPISKDKSTCPTCRQPIPSFPKKLHEDIQSQFDILYSLDPSKKHNVEKCPCGKEHQSFVEIVSCDFFSFPCPLRANDETSTQHLIRGKYSFHTIKRHVEGHDCHGVTECNRCTLPNVDSVIDRSTKKRKPHEYSLRDFKTHFDHHDDLLGFLENLNGLTFLMESSERGAGKLLQRDPQQFQEFKDIMNIFITFLSYQFLSMDDIMQSINPELEKELGVLVEMIRCTCPTLLKLSTLINGKKNIWRLLPSFELNIAHKSQMLRDIDQTVTLIKHNFNRLFPKVSDEQKSAMKTILHHLGNQSQTQEEKKDTTTATTTLNNPIITVQRTTTTDSAQFEGGQSPYTDDEEDEDDNDEDKDDDSESDDDEKMEICNDCIQRLTAEANNTIATINIPSSSSNNTLHRHEDSEEDEYEGEYDADEEQEQREASIAVVLHAFDNWCNAIKPYFLHPPL
jgi:hypothetical protein